jgi:hypothetical protein
MQKAWQEVTQGSQGLGSFAGATSLLPQGHIPFVVQSVRNAPVTPTDKGQGSGIGPVSRRAGEVGVAFLGNRLAALVGLVAFNGHDLL